MSQVSDQRLIRQQADRISLLEEELRQEREKSIHALRLPTEWNLEPAMEKIVLALYAATGGYLTKERLFDAVTKWSATGSMSIISVQVCRMRKRLAPFGVEILTRWGSGYELPATSKAIVKAAIKQRASA